MKKYTVEYSAGDSRMHPGVGVDYMLAALDDVELYAEAVAQDDENANYDDLRQAIIEQANENEIATDSLKFWYD